MAALAACKDRPTFGEAVLVYRLPPN